jgi:two-component system, cell cycle sensor histidine kinase and response regulator CckA
VILVVLCTAPASVSALDNPLDLRREVVDGRYLIHHWDLTDGLPQASITDIAQGADGFLWLTTFGGLVRFDGREFRPAGGAPTSAGWNPRMTAVEASLGGSLFVGLQSGGVVRFEDGAFVDLEQPAELRDATVWDLAIGPNGLLVAADGGCWVHGEDGWLALELPASRGHTSGTAVAWDARGAGWIGSPEGLDRVEPSGAREAFTDDGRLRAVSALRPDESGGLWVGGAGYVGYVLGEELWLHPTLEQDIGSVRDLVVDGEGDLWAVGVTAVCRMGRATEVQRSLMQGTAPPRVERWTVPSSIRCAFADRERNLWVGSDGRGLWSFGRQEFVRFGTGEGLPSPSAGAQIGDGHGGLWVASGCQGLVQLQDGRFTPAPEPLPASGCCNALLRGSDHALWTGCGDDIQRFVDGDDGLEPAGSWEVGSAVTSLLEAPDGVIWAGTAGSGVASIRGDRLEPMSLDEGLGDPYVNALAVEPGGALWFGHRSGSTRLEGDRITVLDEAAGHPPGMVRTFLVDDDGTVWLGTYGGGLARYRDGSFQRYSTRDGLFDDVVSQILDDGEGWLWVNGNRGVSRIRRSDLDGLAAGERSSLRAASFPTGEGNGGFQPAGWRDESGWMYFATIDGVVGFSPDGVRQNDQPPRVQLDSAWLDESDLLTGADVQVPAGNGDLEVHYSSASLRRPDLTRFEYRLAGRDTRWLSAGTRRVIRYTNLAPGHYVLEVHAHNEDDVASEVPARLAFTLEPHFYQTWLFRLLVAAGLVAVGGGLGFTRTRRIRAHNRVLRSEIERRRAAQAALRDQEQHYRHIVEGATDGFLLADGAGHWVDANSAACELFAYTREALLGCAVDELFEHDPLTAESPVLALDSDPVPVVVCRRHDGSTFAAHVLAALFVSGGEPRTLLTVTDVSALMHAESEKRELQSRLADAHRLEALGRLAGGIAHDFNNTLTVVEGNADLLNMMLKPEPASRIDHCLHQIRECSHRANRMIRQLLAFGRQQTLEPDYLDPGGVVGNLESMFRRLLRDDVELEIEIEDDIGFIYADLSQAEQSLVNLLINAGDAMPDGGQLTVRVERVSAAEIHRAHPDIDLLADQICISVEDTGTGIPEELRKRIFEPFFSTKPVGKGTGLGLASVHGFVTQSEGQLGVRSSLGEGTRFDIYLPCVDGIPTGETVLPAVGAIPRGTETVLLCDDDRMVRQSVAGVLAEQGFVVLEAGHGRDALELLNEKSDHISALVTDVVMPEINGYELAAIAREIQPDIRVLFVTGYALDVEMEQLGDGVQAVLSKPFSAASLVQELRDLLDR